MLKDNIKNRIAEVAVQKGELLCQLCDEKDCTYWLCVLTANVYEVLNAKGIRHSR